MTVEEFAETIVAEMPVTPTLQQRALIDALSRFCSAQTPPLSVFLLNGYAGTGKTSVIAALVKALRRIRRSTVLLAPTGRAAKVLSSHAGRKAFTIHRKIYRSEEPGVSVAIAGVADNPYQNAIFIVDEASMIGMGDHTSLLDDLCHYVYGSGTDCRMILLGDSAQLPPVGCEQSPAMTVDVLKGYGLRVSRAVLTQTVRQQADSGILYNATRLRKAMKIDPLPLPQLVATPFSDVNVVDSEDLEESLTAAYRRYGIENTILITRSNRRAMEFNLAIRRLILEKEEVITRGEPILICKNNYYWTSKIKSADFIANGDIAFINRIYGTENRGMLRFADVELNFPDRELTIDTKIILNTFNAETAGFNPEHEQMLISQTLDGYDTATISDPSMRGKVLRQDPWFNALQVKYAYAVTCHKAQGGQWDSVFVDAGGIQPEALTTMDFYRWLYTAVTRAKKELSLIAPSFAVK